MLEHITRRESMRRGLAATSLLALLPEWAVPALAQGETVVPSRTSRPTSTPRRARNGELSISARSTARSRPKDQFFTTQHLGIR